MTTVSPLIFAAHFMACYLSTSSYNETRSLEDDFKAGAPGIVTIYTLVAVVSIAGVAYWGYRRWQANLELASDDPKTLARVKRYRRLGMISFLLSLLSGVGVLVVGFLSPFVG